VRKGGIEWLPCTVPDCSGGAGEASPKENTIGPSFQLADDSADLRAFGGKGSASKIGRPHGCKTASSSHSHPIKQPPKMEMTASQRSFNALWRRR
jgi:hypothetical protein